MRKILPLMALAVVCGTYSLAADESIPDETEPICYSVAEHDELIAKWHADLDSLEEAEDRIGVLESSLALAEGRLRVAEFDLQIARKQTALLELQVPGFWKRNFGRSFWTGAVAGAIAWEYMEPEP